MKTRIACIAVIVVVPALTTSSARAAGPIPAAMIAKVGDPVGTSTISAVNSPFTDGNGRVGFVASLADGQRIIWHNAGPVFFSGSAAQTLTGAEGTMGVSNSGGFVYSPSINGEDGVYTHNGPLLRGTDPAPGFAGQFITFNSRPTMQPDGTAWWIAGRSATSGGSTQNRTLYRSTDTATPVIVPVLSTGDVVGGFTIQASSGVDFDFDVSDNNAHHVHVLDTTEATASDLFLYVDGVMAHREGTATGSGDNWLDFNSPGINNAGNYVFGARTSTATFDIAVAYNGAIKVREGNTLDGLTLASGAAIRALSINNSNLVAHVWGWGSGASLVEALFVGDGPTLDTSSSLILRTGDTLDVNGDMIADLQVFDFKAAGSTIGPALDLADDGYLYIELGLGPIGGAEEFEAIVRIIAPEPASLSLLALAGLAALRRRR